MGISSLKFPAVLASQETRLQSSYRGLVFHWCALLEAKFLEQWSIFPCRGRGEIDEFSELECGWRFSNVAAQLWCV